MWVFDMDSRPGDNDGKVEEKIVSGGPDQCGIVGMSLPKAVLSIL